MDYIPFLVHPFLERQNQAQRRSLTIMPEALQALQTFAWPGNVRELENVLERVTYLVPHNVIALADLPPEIRATSENPTSQSPTPPATSSWQHQTVAALDYLAAKGLRGQ